MNSWNIPLFGTVLNVIVVIVAGCLGLLMKKKLQANHVDAVKIALGLSAIPIGVMLFLGTVNPVVVLISVTAGFLIGYWLRVEERLSKFGGFLRTIAEKVGLTDSGERADEVKKFVNAFVLATVVSLIGPLAIMGPTIEGLTGDTALLETKMVFDGFATLVFAASLGEGVLFSAIPIFIFQGALAMLANVFSPIFLPAGCEYENVFNVPLSKVVSGCIMGRKMIDEMTAVGGVLIMAMGIKVSGLKEDLSVENFLPAIFLAIVLTPIFARLM